MLKWKFNKLATSLVLACALIAMANTAMAQRPAATPTPSPSDPTRPPGQEQLPESARPQTQNPQAPPGAPQTNPQAPPGTTQTSPTTPPGAGVAPSPTPLPGDTQEPREPNIP